RSTQNQSVLDINLEAGSKQVKLNVEHDFAGRSLMQCLQEGYGYKINMKQNIANEFNSVIFPGTVMKISDCLIESKLVKDKSNGNFIANHKYDWTCNDKKWSDDTTNIKLINGPESSQYLISYVHESDYYKGLNINLSYDRSTQNQSVLDINLEAGSKQVKLNVEHDFAGRSLMQCLQEGYGYKINM
ncbi:MAG: hypothetical protein GY739_11880, partial [Mesoflavibacter sp.]|nr:hypothetical protein [Mesoflavibacter sp.]